MRVPKRENSTLFIKIVLNEILRSQLYLVGSLIKINYTCSYKKCLYLVLVEFYSAYSSSNFEQDCFFETLLQNLNQAFRVETRENCSKLLENARIADFGPCSKSPNPYMSLVPKLFSRPIDLMF